MRSKGCPQTGWAIACLGVLTLLLGVLWWRWLQPVFGYTMDDSFITYRYARHLATGDGISWNIGEMVPTEGYTSLFWVWVMALVACLGLDQVLWAKWLSLLMLVGCAWSVFLGAWSIGRSRSSRLLGAAAGVGLFAFNGNLLLHMVSGMETAAAILLMLLIGAMVVRLDRVMLDEKVVPTRGLLCLAVLVALSALNRPESLLTSGLAVFWLVWQHSRRWPQLLLWGGVPFGALLGVYLVWRIAQYGFALPLPFYIKVSSPGHLAGLPDVLSFLGSVSPVLLSLAGGLTSPVLRRLLAPLLLMVAGHLAFFVLPEHIMGMGFRFLMPVWGVLCLGFALMVSVLMNRVESDALGRAAVGGVACFVLVFSAKFNLPRESAGMAWYRDGMAHAHVRLGQLLAGSQGHHTIALGDAGAVSYYSNWRVIDTFGLNNKAIAMARFAGRYAPELVLRERPALIVFISRQCAVFDPPLVHEKGLMDAALARGYRLAVVYRFAEAYHLQVFYRPDNDGAKLTERLREQQGAADCPVSRG